jgi:hypothetical protein
MTGYTLKISPVEDSNEISLKGPQLNCSKPAEITREQTRILSRLYYAKDEYQEEDYAIIEEIEKNFFPAGSLKHYSHQRSLEVKAIGQYIFHKVLPKEIANAIRSLPPNSIIRLEIDDSVSQLPWEFMYTDRNFLCLEHILGRISGAVNEKYVPIQGTIPVLMVSNPTGDLFGARKEANYIMSQLRGSNLRITMYGSEIKKNEYLQLLESGKFSIIHYSGHSASSPEPGKSCHVFMDDLCYGYEIERLNMKNPPLLVFSNSCQSAEASLNKDETGNTSLAGSYLRAGVGGCVGTIWSVSDIGSADIASDFYRYLLFGATFGEALLNARKAEFKRWGYSNWIWASYILFGDPEIRLVKRI